MKSILELFDTDTYIVKSVKTFKEDYRLNAEYFSHDNSYEFDENIETKKLSKLAQIIGFGPFKRYYIKDKKLGIPLISSSGMMELEPSYDSIISKEFNPDWLKYVVNRNTILVSCSGTIGNVTLVDSRLQGMAISQHALRVIVTDETYVGLIYTFLTSEFGKSLLSGKKSGAVIDEIYENDLNRIDIPIIDLGTKIKLNELILTAFRKRDEANELLINAKEFVLKYNNLPPLDETETKTIDPEKEIEIRMVSTEEFANDYRLDAHFYNPMAKKAADNIAEFSSKYGQLNNPNITSHIYYLNRFSRTFVSKEYGIPYLAGKDLIMIKPYDISYLSKTETYNLNEYKLKKGWILMTCSGTLGRTCYIWNNYENWVGTHDLIRIISSTEFDSGYLLAFLSSPYGYHQALRYKHGAVIDHLTPDQISEILIPIPEDIKIKEIGDLVRQAYDLRAEAIYLEEEAQKILTIALTGK